jgi:chitinase
MSRLGFHKNIGIIVATVVFMAFLTAGVSAWQIPAWAPNTAYAVNQQVTHTGNTYRCLQAHTSLVGWEPPNVPALWERVTTPVPNCTVAPGAPTGLTSPAKTSTSVSLSWNAASPGANCTITGYQIFRNGTLATTTSGTGTTFTVTGLTANTTYRFAVAAVNQFGASARSGEIPVTTNATGPACSTAPGIPTGLNSPSKTSTSVSLAWNAATAGANCAITGYRIFRDGTLITTTSGTGTTNQVTGLTPNTTYRFTVAAVNQFSASAQSAAIMVTTNPGATGVPAKPM